VTVPDEPVPGGDATLVDRQAVWRGALLGLLVLVAASVVEALLDRNIDTFRDSGWIYPLFVAILVGYALGGWEAGRMAPDAALTNGVLAGLGAFVLWIPVRIVIWLVRDENRGLFSGHSPALRPGQILGHLVIAAALGMLGGWLGSRSVRRAARGPRSTDGPPAKR
jgi:hypothetical protein